MGFVTQDSQPIGAKLVPASLLYEFIDKGKIAFAENSDFYIVADHRNSMNVLLRWYVPIEQRD